MELFGLNPSRRYSNRIYPPYIKQQTRSQLWTPLFTQKHELLETSWSEKNTTDHKGNWRWYSLVLESKNSIELRQSSTRTLSNRKHFMFHWDAQLGAKKNICV